MYLSMFFGPISGILNTVNITFQNECREDTPFTVAAVVCSFFSAFFLAAVKFGNFEENSTKHKQFSARYSSLENNIKRQLTLKPEYREKPNDYYVFIGKNFDDLTENSPRIPSRISKDFVHKAKKNKLAIPDVFSIDVSKTLTTIQEEEKKFKKKKEDSPKKNVDAEKFSDGAVKYELQRLFQK